ncbi:unnamed protein product [Gadus morhua 'NCC']
MQQKALYSNLIPSADVKDGRYWFKTQDSLDGVMLPAGLDQACCPMHLLEVNIWIILMEQTSLPSVEDGLRPIVGT